MDVWRDKRLRLSITRLGWEYLLAVLLLGAAAVNTGNNLLYLVLSLMLGVFLVSGWVSRRAIQDLRPDRIDEGNVFARVRGGLRVRLRDGAPGRLRGVEVHLELEDVRVEPGFLRGGEGASTGPVTLHLRPPRRGWTPMKWLEFRTSFPFGFLEKSWRFPLDQRLLVLPHPRVLPSRPELAGERTLPRPRAGSDSPDGARPFRDRDPLSHVHWKRTAQRGTPWVRTFEDDEPAGTRLRLDLRAWEPGPAFERELEVLSGCVLQARLQRRRISLEVTGLDGREEREGCTPCWRLLAQVQAGGLCRGPEIH
jgi:uncharacterized protein (DUF58 family)